MEMKRSGHFHSENSTSPGSTLSSFGSKHSKLSLKKAPTPPTRTSSFRDQMVQPWAGEEEGMDQQISSCDRSYSSKSHSTVMSESVLSRSKPHWSNEALLSESFSDHVRSQSSSDDLLSTSASQSRSGSFDRMLMSRKASHEHVPASLVDSSNDQQELGHKSPDTDVSDSSFPPPPAFLLEEQKNFVPIPSKRMTQKVKEKSNIPSGSLNRRQTAMAREVFEEETFTDSGHSSPAVGFLSGNASGIPVSKESLPPNSHCITIPKRAATMTCKEELVEVLGRRRQHDMVKCDEVKNAPLEKPMTNSNAPYLSLIKKKKTVNHDNVSPEKTSNFSKIVSGMPMPEIRKKVEDWQAGVEKSLNQNISKGPEVAYPREVIHLNKVGAPEKPNLDLNFSSLRGRSSDGQKSPLEQNKPDESNSFHVISISNSTHRGSPKLGVAALKEKRMSTCELSAGSKKGDIERETDQKFILPKLRPIVRENLNSKKLEAAENIPSPKEDVKIDKFPMTKKNATQDTAIESALRQDLARIKLRKSPGFCSEDAPDVSEMARRSFIKPEAEPHLAFLNELRNLGSKSSQINKRTKPSPDSSDLKSADEDSSNIKRKLTYSTTPFPSSCGATNTSLISFSESAFHSDEIVVDKHNLTRMLASVQSKLISLRTEMNNSKSAPSSLINISDDLQILLRACTSYVGSLPPHMKFQFRDIMVTMETSGEAFCKSSLNTMPSRKFQQPLEAFTEALKHLEEILKKWIIWSHLVVGGRCFPWQIVLLLMFLVFAYLINEDLLALLRPCLRLILEFSFLNCFVFF